MALTEMERELKERLEKIIKAYLALKKAGLDEKDIMTILKIRS